MCGLLYFGVYTKQGEGKVDIALTNASLSARRRILSACVRIFLEKGYRRATLAEIIERSDVSLDEVDLATSLSASMTSISNVGPALSLAGPTRNFAIFSPLSKLALSFTMLLGRLEIMPLLVLFLPSVWRKK